MGCRAVENRVCGRVIDAVFGHRCATHRAQRFTLFLENRIVRSQIRWTNYGDQSVVQPVDKTDEFFPCTTLVDASFLIHGDSVRFLGTLRAVDRAGSERMRSRSQTELPRADIRRNTLRATPD